MTTDADLWLIMDKPRTLGKTGPHETDADLWLIMDKPRTLDKAGPHDTNRS